MRTSGTITKERAETPKGRFTKEAQLARWEAVHGKRTTKGKEEELEVAGSTTAAEENEAGGRRDEGDGESEEDMELDDGGVGLPRMNNDQDENDDEQGQAAEQMRPEPMAIGE